MKVVTLFLAILTIIIFPYTSESQTSEIDSLESLILEYDLRDTSRVNLLNTAAAALQNIAPERALKHLTQAGEIADELDYKKGKSDYYEQMAAYYYVASEFDKVLEFVNKSLAINQDIGNEKGIAKNYYDIGKVYYFQGIVDKATDYLKMAIEINTTLKDSASLCFCYASLGTNYSDLGDYDLALKYEEKALEIANKINDEEAISFALNNLGVIYDHLGNWPKALECYQKSLLIDERKKNFRDAAIAASNVAHILRIKGNYKDALNYCLKGVDYSEKIGFKTGLSYNYEIIGNIYMDQGQYDSALEYQQKTLALQQKIGNKQGEVIAFRDLADVLVLQNKFAKAMDYYKTTIRLSKLISYKRTEVSSYIGIANIYNKQKNYSEAYRFSKKANNMAKEIDDLKFISQSAGILAESCEKLGLFKEAYAAHLSFKAMSDSLFNEDKIRKISNLEYEYKAEKERELIKLEQHKKDRIQAAELRKQKIMRNALFAGLLFMVLLAIVILRGFVQKRKANQLLNNKNLEINKQAKELQQSNESLLQLSKFKEDMTNMVVHDLKTPLSALINIDIISGESDRDEVVQHLAGTMLSMVKNILDVYKYESVELELNKENIDLITTINSAIKEVGFMAKLSDLHFDIPLQNKIEVNSDAMVLSRIFSNLLSNAVKFSSRKNAITIKSVVSESGILKVTIHNHGSFITLEQQKHIFTKFGQVKSDASKRMHSTGLGLTYCAMAIKAHGGEIGVESTKEGGTTFWFTLPEAQESLHTQQQAVEHCN